MKSIIFSAAMLLCAGSLTVYGADYIVKANVPQLSDGATVYMLDFDSGAKLDSVVVENAEITIKGEIDKPALVRLTSDDKRLGTFIIEPGSAVTVTDGIAVGGELNKRMDDFEAAVGALEEEMQKAEDDATRQAITDKYYKLVEDTLAANADNPIGYYLFLQNAYEMNRQEMNEALTQFPQFADYRRVKNVLNFFDAQELTAVGKKFTDFTIDTPDGPKSLSDYVGKDKLLLVDMWASWCGPCRRESAVIKQLYDKYHKDGFEVLGVAVWDKVDNTLEAIKQLELPWPQIIDAQNVPTDLYGVSGIPFIMLLSKDGTIRARGIQGETLVKFVENYMAE